MKNILKWILLVWTVLGIPYCFNSDLATTFFSLVYVGLLLGILISDVVAHAKAKKKD